jgi:hypothetical protein
MDTLIILVISLAVWRISNLLYDVEQAGPLGLMDKVRFFLGVRFDNEGQPITEPGSLAEGVLCVYCNSLWIGLSFTLLFVINKMVAFVVALPFAWSTAGIIIDILIRKLKGEFSESKDRDSSEPASRST